VLVRDPRARRSPLKEAGTLERGGARSRVREPSSAADLARGGPLLGRSSGARGPPRRGLCCVCTFCVRFEVCFAFCIFAGFKQDSPRFFREPSWLSPTDPTRECVVVLANDQANTANAAEAGDGEVPLGPGTGPHLGAGPSAPPPSQSRGADINAQLAQARELEAKLAEEYRAVRLLRASIPGEGSARGERTRELGRQARERINVDFDVDNPNTPPRASQKLVATATLLRAMPALSMPEAQNLQAAVQQAESSASRIRQQGSARDDGGAQGPEASVHAGGTAERPANPGRTPIRERILDTRRQAQDGDARNVINARRTGSTETREAAGYHPRRGGRPPAGWAL
jgi:hypothetical protein